MLAEKRLSTNAPAKGASNIAPFWIACNRPEAAPRFSRKFVAKKTFDEIANLALKVWRGPPFSAATRTNLADAIAFIGARHPDHTPKRYGCSSWRQVLHESKLFDVRRDKAMDAAPGATWYRPRDRFRPTANLGD